MALRLQQGQVWKFGGEFIRIVRLERLAVEYKLCKNLKVGEGKHLQVTKKEFCRLLKTATLVSSPQTVKASSSPPPPA